MSTAKAEDLAQVDTLSFEEGIEKCEAKDRIPFPASRTSLVCVCSNVLFYSDDKNLYYCKLSDKDNSNGDVNQGKLTLDTKIIRLTALIDEIIVFTEKYITFYGMKDNTTPSQIKKISNIYKDIICEYVVDKKAVFYLTKDQLILFEKDKNEAEILFKYGEQEDEKFKSIKQLVGDLNLTGFIGVSTTSYVLIFETKMVLVSSMKNNLIQQDFSRPITNATLNKSAFFIITDSRIYVYQVKITKMYDFIKVGIWNVPKDSNIVTMDGSVYVINNKNMISLKWNTKSKFLTVEQCKLGSTFLELCSIADDKYVCKNSTSFTTEVNTKPVIKHLNYVEGSEGPEPEAKKQTKQTKQVAVEEKKEPVEKKQEDTNKQIESTPKKAEAIKTTPKKVKPAKADHPIDDEVTRQIEKMNQDMTKIFDFCNESMRAPYCLDFINKVSSFQFN